MVEPVEPERVLPIVDDPTLPEVLLEEDLTLDEDEDEDPVLLATEVTPDLEEVDVLPAGLAVLDLVTPDVLVAAPLLALEVAEDLTPAVLETEPMPLLMPDPVVEIRGVLILVPPPKWS